MSRTAAPAADLSAFGPAGTLPAAGLVLAELDRAASTVARLSVRSGHVCDGGDFDRTLCPEPCSTMHSYCSGCGALQDDCAHAG